MSRHSYVLHVRVFLSSAIHHAGAEPISASAHACSSRMRFMMACRLLRCFTDCACWHASAASVGNINVDLFLDGYLYGAPARPGCAASERPQRRRLEHLL